jgi:hypothetical protein
MVGLRASPLRFFEDSITNERVYPDYPPPYQLAVLRRIQQCGKRVDLQLCQLSLPEMGDVGVDRVLLEGFLRGVDSSNILAPVNPVLCDKHRLKCREFWPVSELWHTAELARRVSGSADAKDFHRRSAERRLLLQRSGQQTVDSERRHYEAQLVSEFRVPRLSRLAMDALPEFLTPGKPAWKRLIKPYNHEELARARERNAAVCLHDGADTEETHNWKPWEIR